MVSLQLSIIMRQGYFMSLCCLTSSDFLHSSLLLDIRYFILPFLLSHLVVSQANPIFELSQGASLCLSFCLTCWSHWLVSSICYLKSFSPRAYTIFVGMIIPPNLKNQMSSWVHVRSTRQIAKFYPIAQAQTQKLVQVFRLSKHNHYNKNGTSSILYGQWVSSFCLGVLVLVIAKQKKPCVHRESEMGANTIRVDFIVQIDLSHHQRSQHVLEHTFNVGTEALLGLYRSHGSFYLMRIELYDSGWLWSSWVRIQIWFGALFLRCDEWCVLRLAWFVFNTDRLVTEMSRCVVLFIYKALGSAHLVHMMTGWNRSSGSSAFGGAWSNVWLRGKRWIDRKAVLEIKESSCPIDWMWKMHWLDTQSRVWGRVQGRDLSVIDGGGVDEMRLKDVRLRS